MAGMAIYVVVMNGWLSCNSANDGTPCGARERADARRADVKKDAAQRRDIVEPVKNRDIQGRTMQLRVLGCSGGVGQGLRTTSLLLDNDVLIDAGSGVGDLSLDEMARIRHIFLTHSHLDHIAYIPLLNDSNFDQRQPPQIIHGQPETLQALQQHIFNWVIWPDFHKLPTPQRPVMQYEIMKPGEVVALEGRTLEMIPVVHAVPAVGYRIACAGGVGAGGGGAAAGGGGGGGRGGRGRRGGGGGGAAGADGGRAGGRRAK